MRDCGIVRLKQTVASPCARWPIVTSGKDYKHGTAFAGLVDARGSWFNRVVTPPIGGNAHSGSQIDLLREP